MRLIGNHLIYMSICDSVKECRRSNYGGIAASDAVTNGSLGIERTIRSLRYVPSARVRTGTSREKQKKHNPPLKVLCSDRHSLEVRLHVVPPYRSTLHYLIGGRSKSTNGRLHCQISKLRNHGLFLGQKLD